MKRSIVPVALLLAAVAGCGGVPSGSVATIDGEPIDMKAFDHWLAVAARSSGQPNAQVPKPPDYAACVSEKRKTQPKPAKGETKPTDTQLKEQCKQEYERLRSQALQLLISIEWLEGEARDRKISVTDAEVKQSFEQQKKQSFPKKADYEKFLEQSGQTEQDIMLRVRLDLLSSKIRDQVTKGKDKVTDKQIADYYEENKERFAQPEQRHLRIVMTKTKAEAAEAKAQLADGRPWKKVVKRYSIDAASRSAGGALHGVVEGQQEKPLDEAIFAADKGKLSGPVKTQFGYYVFELTKVDTGSQQTLKQAKETIKQLIVSDNQQKAVDAFTKDFREKWKPRTECLEGYETQDCDNGPEDTPAPATQQPTA